MRQRPIILSCFQMQNARIILTKCLLSILFIEQSLRVRLHKFFHNRSKQSPLQTDNNTFIPTVQNAVSFYTN